ncbi:MAG: SGNH/GDSL hydrolase family protein [Bacteroidota bacterium]
MKKLYTAIIFTCSILTNMDADAQLRLDRKSTITFLALGDSYTIGESVPEAGRWPEQLAAALRKKGVQVEKPVIIAKTGWRTDQLAQAIAASGTPDNYELVSLLIGVNNQYQGRTPESYEPEFKALLETAVKKAGGKQDRVFVVSIPDYGFTPFGQPKQAQITEALDRYNAINERITRAAGIAYFSITDLSREGLKDPELVAADKLHPSAKQYGQWVDRILPGFTVR